MSGEVVAHGAPAGDPSAHWLQYGPVPGADSSRYGFTPRQMARIDEAITYSTRETGLTFSVYLGSLDETDGDRGRATAEAMFSKLAADGIESPVLVAVSPDQRVLQIVTGEYSSHRIPNRQCALAALGMRAAFAGGDLTGGIVTGLRMLADAAGAPRTS
ncbi:DUF5130 family protein [Jatrophihabitans sp. YIM 134969]